MSISQHVRFPILALGGLLLLSQTAWCQTADWRPLFDGKSLEGWVQRGGQANYRVEEECIVGTTVPKTPNSFLCTESDYGDFQLILEFKVDPELNSGVQIRSESREDYRSGRVHGYQTEIDPSIRAYTGGIYDEARRGWLFPLDRNRAAREAFRQHEWNELRIEAIGNRIRTWLNGVPATDLTDDKTPRGFLALQVHGVGARQDPLEVRWRNLRIRETTTRWPEAESASAATATTPTFQPDTLKKLADGFRFLEGPAVGPEGKIYFNDIPNNTTHVYDPESGQVGVHRKPSGKANGMFWAPNDFLIACEGGTRALTQTSRGETRVLADSFAGKRLNSPNDLVLDAAGGIYFSDPRYGNRDNLEQDVEGVYYRPHNGKLVRVIDNLTRPNGVILSPDGTVLYVADQAAQQIWAYDVSQPGKLENPRKLADIGSDGMSIDPQGNVYCTFGAHVIVLNPAGEEVARLEVPENPANCLVVGEKLYITARTGFYVVDRSR